MIYHTCHHTPCSKFVIVNISYALLDMYLRTERYVSLLLVILLLFIFLRLVVALDIKRAIF